MKIFSTPKLVLVTIVLAVAFCVSTGGKYISMKGRARAETVEKPNIRIGEISNQARSVSPIESRVPPAIKPPPGRISSQLRNPSQPPLFKDGETTALGADGRIWHRGRGAEVLAATIAELRGETPTESVEKLNKVGLYYNPGTQLAHSDAQSYEGRRRVTEDFLVEAPLSNRRFLKTLQELTTMSKAEASKLVSDELDATLADFRLEENKRIELAKKRIAQGQAGGMSNEISDPKDGRITFQGMRLKLASLMLEAGSLQLVEAHEAVARVAQVAIDQRNNLADPTFLDETFRISMVRQDSIFSSRAIATALLGTAPDTSRKTPDWVEIPLTTFDATRTSFETPDHASSAPGANFSKGRQSIFIHRSMLDKDFDAMFAGMK